MKILNSIKKYIKKVKGEIGKEDSINSPGKKGDQDENSSDFSQRTLPKIWTGVDLDGTLAH